MQANIQGMIKKRQLNLCPFCGDRILWSEFKDELSQKEFIISGLCQTCQDRVFETCEVPGKGTQR